MATTQLEHNVSDTTALCVDVDGTLLCSDLLHESILRLVKQRPWLLPLVPLWLLRGRAYLKQQLSLSIALSEALPLNQGLLRFLTTESANGRRVLLCSGADEHLVTLVAAQLSFAVEVMASNGSVNLTGEAKANALVARFGSGGFDYAGNASDDLAVWHHARRAIVVNASRNVQRAAEAQGNVSMVLPRTRALIPSTLRALRPHQWVKNTLVFVPLITSHNILHSGLLGTASLAFISLSCCASAIYIMNDLADIDADRKHYSKRARPFASGDLPIPVGMCLAPLLLATGVGLSVFLPPMAALLLILYSTLAFIYTFWLKQKLLADVITLSLLYTVRIVEGGAATSILVSPWLLAFSLFFFLSLAFSKRVTEMLRLALTDRSGVEGRAYFVPDATTLATLGAVSGYLSCMVLSLYINSDTVRALYAHPGWLWLLLPLLLNWIGRVWVLTMRGRMADDPIMFVCTDLATHITLLSAGVLILLATLCPIGIPGIEE